MKSKRHRRREIASIGYEIAKAYAEDNGQEFYIEDVFDDVNDKLEEEGLPVFKTFGEMTRAVQEQYDHEAKAIRALIELLEKAGANCLADIDDNTKQGALEKSLKE